MNKNEEDKLANAIITLHQEIKGMRSDMEKHQMKTNLVLGELRLSYMKLDESFNRYAKSNAEILNNHETRIEGLEEKTSGSPYSVSESPAQYKKRKKK